MNDELNRTDGDGVAVRKQNVFTCGNCAIGKLRSVGTPKIPDEQAFAVEGELAVTSADISDGDAQLALFAAANDGVAAQRNVADSRFVVDDFESDVHGHR
ncbi:MAG: hypothetical protein MK004_20540 [Planctomycetales bacterium]|nr:hypothetical protein [Planctomycetales bacterium]